MDIPTGTYRAWAVRDASAPRVFVECLRCLTDEPARDVGHVFAASTTAEAARLTRNHLAQQHDVLPAPPSTAPTSPGRLR